MFSSRHRLFACVLVFAAARAAGFAQPAPKRVPQTLPANSADRARAILDAAHAAPVEVFGDIALGASLSSRPNLLTTLPDKEKAPLLEEIFRRAGEARDALPLRYVGAGRASGTAADTEAAHRLQLDALSLRCRVVQTLLRIDPKLARELGSVTK